MARRKPAWTWVDEGCDRDDVGGCSGTAAAASNSAPATGGSSDAVQQPVVSGAGSPKGRGFVHHLEGGQRR